LEERYSKVWICPNGLFKTEKREGQKPKGSRNCKMFEQVSKSRLKMKVVKLLLAYD
jgi:hypothetical protein